MDLESPRYIAGTLFSNALMNGAYIGSKTMEDVQTLVHSSAGAIVVGSITEEPRTANPSGGYWRHKERFFTLNSYGMPNGGIPYFEKQLPRMVTLAHRYGKPLLANIAGFTANEYVHLIQLAEASGVDMVELNLGCPNTWKDGHQERIISYHASLVREILEAIAQHKPQVSLCAKISPLPPDILVEVGNILAKSKIIQAVTATNSYPNASLTSGTGKHPDGTDLLAGMSGRALKPISVGVVKQLRSILPERMTIIGCGGITTANDVQDYLDAGAQAIQIASGLLDGGPSTFDKILYQSVHALTNITNP